MPSDGPIHNSKNALSFTSESACSESDRYLGLGTPSTLYPSPCLHRKTILMISDFFYPDTGGVEMNIWATSQCLRRMGHKVIIVTATKGGRIGVRYMSNIKCYYLPQQRWIYNVVMPSGMSIPILRSIMLREKAEIVHVHQCTTPIGIESFFVARLLGIHTIYHDHSLFSIADPFGYHVNKILNCVIRSAVSKVVTVSNTNKENLLIRAGVPSSKVYVIPNAIDPIQFRPTSYENKDPDFVTVITVIRMTYRKGVDLLIDLIPDTCHQFPNVKFMIGGDGPKFKELMHVVEEEGIKDRVTLLGRVHPASVGSLLHKGDIYLNPSLTEAFGISLLEAASAGLYVVSTNVGGIPEVLPKEFMTMANPNSDELIRALWRTIIYFKMGQLPGPKQISDCCSDLYSWSDVARRSEIVYNDAMSTPVERSMVKLLVNSWQELRMSSLLTIVVWIYAYAIASIAEWYNPCEMLDDVVDYRILNHAV